MAEIRQAILDDWETFHRIDIEIFPEDAMWEDSFRKRVEDDGFFILELQNEMIGYLLVQRYGKDEGYVARIGVVEEHRGEGFGKLLMKHGLYWFRKQGNIKAVHLQADL
ncbi:MAG: GNAT family N-acetyltransferase, partial [Candidatus Thorarchaeota archaeon]